MAPGRLHLSAIALLLAVAFYYLELTSLVPTSLLLHLPTSVANVLGGEQVVLGGEPAAQEVSPVKLMPPHYIFFVSLCECEGLRGGRT